MIEVASAAGQEQISIKMALFARGLTLIDGALLLAEHDRLLGFRIHSRGVIETTMFMIALGEDPQLIDRLKDDDLKSRHARAKIHHKMMRADGDPEVRAMLEDFLFDPPEGLKKLNPGDLLRNHDFERLYLTYRDISADAAHVSITSLDRHYVAGGEDTYPILVLHPTLDDVDLHATLTQIGISMTISVLELMKLKRMTDTWENFRVLHQRYVELSRTSNVASVDITAD